MRPVRPHAARGTASLAFVLLAVATATPRVARAEKPAPDADPSAALAARIDILAEHARRRVLPLVQLSRSGEVPREHADAEVGRFERALGAVARGIASLPPERAARLAGRLRALQRSVTRPLPSPTATVRPAAVEKAVGLVSGTVTEASTGDPIPDAEVTIWLGDASWGWTSTDENGVYSFIVEPGTYTLAAEVFFSELMSELFEDLSCPGGPGAGCDPEDGTPVVVTSSGATSGIDFSLEVGGSIEGTVVDAVSGDPIGSAEVYPFDADGDPTGNDFWHFTATEPNGTYAVRGLGTGNCFLRADNEAHVARLYDELPCAPGCDPLTGTAVPVVSGATTTGIDFALPARGGISGRVTDSRTGQVLAFWGDVRVTTLAGSFVGTGFISGDGTYAVGGLLPGDYRVITELYDSYQNEAYDDVPCTPTSDCNALGTPVTVGESQQVTGVDFALSPFGGVRGRVTDAAGNPLPGVTVRVRDPELFFGDSSWTDALGRYETLGLRPGAGYRATTVNSLGYLDERYANVPCSELAGCSSLAGTPIAVALEMVTSGVDFALDFGSALSGRLTEVGTGRPLSGTVEATLIGASSREAEADLNGDWRVLGLPPGTFEVVARAEGHRSEIWDDHPCPGFTCPSGNAVSIPAPGVEIGAIDFALERFGTISGRIVDAVTGTPIVGSIELVPFGAEAVSGWDGTYTTLPLEPDTYRLVATATGYLPQIFSGISCALGSWGAICNFADGTPVPLGLSQDVDGIDFALLPVAVFADGFESGDASAWGAATP